MARILIVDDDARITELLTDFLAEEGHQIGSANDGPDAFEEFKRLKPDLIITDYHMPGGSGAELVARVRASDGGKLVAAIVISGSAADDAAPDLSKLPRLRYLEKPVDLASLKRAVEELLAS